MGLKESGSVGNLQYFLARHYEFPPNLVPSSHHGSIALQNWCMCVGDGVVFSESRFVVESASSNEEAGIGKVPTFSTRCGRSRCHPFRTPHAARRPTALTTLAAIGSREMCHPLLASEAFRERCRCRGEVRGEVPRVLLLRHLLPHGVQDGTARRRSAWGQLLTDPTQSGTTMVHSVAPP